MNLDESTMYLSHQSSSKPADLDELLKYQDWRFVEAAYELLLARKPDKDGYDFYLSRIRGGVSRIRILKEISASPEAASQGRNIKGLRKALRLDTIGSVPVIGSVLRRLFSLEGNSKLEVQLRILEQKNSVLSDMVSEIVSQQSASEIRLSHLVRGDLSKQLNPLFERITSLEDLNARGFQSLTQSLEDLMQRQSGVAQTVEDLRQRQSNFAESVVNLVQRQSAVAQTVEDLVRRQSALAETVEGVVHRQSSVAQSVEDIRQRQSNIETHQLPNVLQTLSDINQRHQATDSDRDNLTRSVPVALRKLARDIAEGERKITKLEALVENRHQ